MNSRHPTSIHLQFQSGHDTLQIAQITGLREAEVYNCLHRHRTHLLEKDQRRAERAAQWSRNKQRNDAIRSATGRSVKPKIPYVGKDEDGRRKAPPLSD